MLYLKMPVPLLFISRSRTVTFLFSFNRKLQHLRLKKTNTTNGILSFSLFSRSYLQRIHYFSQSGRQPFPLREFDLIWDSLRSNSPPLKLSTVKVILLNIALRMQRKWSHSRLFEATSQEPSPPTHSGYRVLGIWKIWRRNGRLTP